MFELCLQEVFKIIVLNYVSKNIWETNAAVLEANGEFHPEDVYVIYRPGSVRRGKNCARGLEKDSKADVSSFSPSSNRQIKPIDPSWGQLKTNGRV